MTFTFHHSLASRAAVSVVLSLWYHEDIDSLKRLAICAGRDEALAASPFDRLRFYLNSPQRIHRLALHKRVRDNVSELLLPICLRKYLLEFIQIVGESLEDFIQNQYRIPTKITAYGYICFAGRFFKIPALISSRYWCAHHSLRVNAPIDVDLRKVLRWNPDGDIDFKHTGEAVVRNESDSIKRFKLACVYCITDEMLRLWPDVRSHFSSIEAWDCSWTCEVSTLFWWRYFRYFWPDPISTYLVHLESIRGGQLIMAELVRSCSHSFGNNCTPITLYLLNNIRLEDIPSISIRGVYLHTADKRFRVCVLRLLESHYDEILRNFPVTAFKQLLHWPHQSFFIDTVERSWDLFPEYLFVSILFRIALLVKMYEDSDIYRHIFHRYWTGSPAHLRNVERIFYNRRAIGGHTFRHFVRVLFGHSTEAEEMVKKELFEGRHVLELATRERVHDVLSELIRTCLPAEERKEKQKLLDKHSASRRRGCNCCTLS